MWSWSISTTSATPILESASATMLPTLPSPMMPTLARARSAWARLPQTLMVACWDGRTGGSGLSSGWKLVASPTGPTTRTHAASIR